MSLIGFLNNRGIEFRKGTKPGEINICCPFCSERGETPDERFRLGVNVYSKKGHCFNCSWGSQSQATKYIMEALSGAYDEDEDNNVIDVEEERKRKKTTSIPEGYTLVIKDGVQWYVKKAYRYLKERGVTRQELERFRVGVTVRGKYRHRILFPIFYKNKLRGIVGRDLTGEREPKYLNSTGDKYLFNLGKAKGEKKLIISEGIFKALAIRRAVEGYRSSSMQGNIISNFQVEQILECGFRTVCIWPDPGIPGLKGMIASAEKLLEAGLKVEVLWPQPKKQADEYETERIAKLFNSLRVRYTWGIAAKMKRALAF